LSLKKLLCKLFSLDLFEEKQKKNLRISLILAGYPVSDLNGYPAGYLISKSRIFRPDIRGIPNINGASSTD
jgi:hypothetical protein